MLFTGRRRPLPVECSEARAENPHGIAINPGPRKTRNCPVESVKNPGTTSVNAAAQSRVIIVVHWDIWRGIVGRKMGKKNPARGRRRGHRVVLRVAGAREAGHHADRRAGHRGDTQVTGRRPQETVEVAVRAGAQRNLADSRLSVNQPRLKQAISFSFCSFWPAIGKLHRPVCRHHRQSRLIRQCRLMSSESRGWLPIQSFRCRARLSKPWQGSLWSLPVLDRKFKDRKCTQRPRPGSEESPPRFLTVCSD